VPGRKIFLPGDVEGPVHSTHEVTLDSLFESAGNFLLCCPRGHYFSHSSENLVTLLKGCSETTYTKTPQGFLDYLDALPLLHTQIVIRNHLSFTAGKEMMVPPDATLLNSLVPY